MGRRLARRALVECSADSCLWPKFSVTRFQSSRRKTPHSLRDAPRPAKGENGQEAAAMVNSATRRKATYDFCDLRHCFNKRRRVVVAGQRRFLQNGLSTLIISRAQVPPKETPTTPHRGQRRSTNSRSRGAARLYRSLAGPAFLRELVFSRGCSAPRGIIVGRKTVLRAGIKASSSMPRIDHQHADSIAGGGLAGLNEVLQTWAVKNVPPERNPF